MSNLPPGVSQSDIDAALAAPFCVVCNQEFTGENDPDVCDDCLQDEGDVMDDDD